MGKMKLVLAVSLLALVLVAIAAEDKQVTAVRGLISRIVPQHASLFVPQLIANPPSEAGHGYFEVESVGNLTYFRGTSGVAMASALNWFLKERCNSQYMWQDQNIDIPKPTPVVYPKYVASTPYKYRYYYNVCTFGYTSPWWNWARWEREIDWMALNGINLPLAFNGQEFIWQKLFREFGVDQDGLDEFFTGPAYLPWQRMGNLNQWRGSLTSEWIQADHDLQMLILKRQREFGMTPVLPAFAGHVPGALKDLFPTSKISQLEKWAGFPGTYYLDPNDPLFGKLGTRAIQIQTHEYGTDHFYNTDPFNEEIPPTNSPSYLSSSAKSIFDSMRTADPKAVWVLQGWFLVHSGHFWQEPQQRAFFDAVPNDGMLVLDLWSELQPAWKQTNGFYGKPFIWNMLHNFGGRTGLYGALPKVATGPYEAFSDSSVNMVGIGLTPEATETNPVMYDFVMDMAWKPVGPVRNISLWVEKYSHRRYGVDMETTKTAWNFLRKSVYGSTDVQEGTTGSVIAARPSFNMSRVGCCASVNMYWDPEDVRKALLYFIYASGGVKTETFLNDLAEVCRQVLSDRAWEYYQKLGQAFEARDVAAFEAFATQFKAIIASTDKILRTRKIFLLSNWLDAARSHSNESLSQNWLELNARTQITVWGGPSLSEYAYKLWAGLVSDYYGMRWTFFLDSVTQTLKTGAPWNQDAFDSAVSLKEQAWITSTNRYPTEPEADTVLVAYDILNRWG